MNNKERYYIKNNKVYYYKHQEPAPILKSIEVIDGEIRLNHHDCNKKIPDAVYDKMKEMLINHYHGVALKVNEFINQLLPGTMIKIHGDVIEIIYDVSNDYIHYDFYTIYPDGISSSGISSGYYWSLRLKKDDSRIGRRKLYKSSKGLYFIENGYRNYINNFYKIKEVI